MKRTPLTRETDALAQARGTMVNLLRRYAEIEHPNHDHPAIARKFERDVASDLEDLDALIRAVRAECAAKAAVVDAINAGEVEQVSGWGNADGPMKFGIRLKGSGPIDFGFGATMQAAYDGARAALAAQREQTP